MFSVSLPKTPKPYCSCFKSRLLTIHNHIGYYQEATCFFYCRFIKKLMEIRRKGMS